VSSVAPVSRAAVRDGVLTVPLVDISSFRMPYPDEAARAQVVRQVDEAARTVGFMQITGHGILPFAVQDLTAAADAFFALDLAAKQRYRCPPGVSRGYTAPRAGLLAGGHGAASAAEGFEGISIGTSVADYPGLDLPENIYARNVYPAEVPNFEGATTAWFRAARAVARTMVRIFGVALGGSEDYFERYTDHSNDVLWIDNYLLPSAAPAGDPGQPRVAAHTDHGIVTVLWADRVPGLEILGADGAWHPVLPVGGALLVNLGDALARWTNDQWISTTHRVVPPRARGELVPRRSAAFFHDGNVDAVIECLPSCVSAQAPARYAPVTVGEHMAARRLGFLGRVLGAQAEELHRMVDRGEARRGGHLLGPLLDGTPLDLDALAADAAGQVMMVHGGRALAVEDLP
jgi:isopenicillin N synthase-like dioxygenase